MSELSKKFKLVDRPVEQGRYYELFVEGDYNDGDYVNSKTRISVEQFENDEYMLYLIVFLQSFGSHFSDKRLWELFEDDAYDDYYFMPSGGDYGVHSITDIRLSYHENGAVKDVSIPWWDELFDDTDDFDAVSAKVKEAQKSRK